MGLCSLRMGYVLIDHRASPGTVAVPSGVLFEADTFTCCHCDSVVVKNPCRTRDRHMCFKCMRLTCDQAGCVVECNPILQSVTLANRFPESGQAFLLRGPRGEALFDQSFRDKETFY